ncbi:MAG: ABC transporter permease, partial [Albidovulum sp.]
MFILEKRPTPSRFWLYATPVVAVILTMIAGGLLFAALGTNP